jgi:hypothetical protein
MMACRTDRSGESRRKLGRALARLLLRGALVASLLSLSLPPTVAVAQDDTRSMTEIRDQGILYYKRERFPLAKAELDKAFARPGGKADFQTVLYRGRAAYKVLILEDAFAMVKLGAELAGEDKRQEAAITEIQTEMSALYGAVRVEKAEQETNTKGRIYFEAKTGIINKEKKQRFLSIRERFRNTDVEVPTTIYMPYGDYLANNVPFSVKKGEETPTVQVFLQIVQTESEENPYLWWYVGGAAAVAVGAGVAAFFLLSEDETVVEQRTRVSVQN